MTQTGKRQRRKFGRIRQFNSGRWQASYTGPDGRVYIAPKTFNAKIDAEAWLTDRRREIDRQLWSPASGQEDRPGAPFGEYAVNRPGMSGDSSSWKGWGHVRWFIEEVPAGAA